MQEQSFITKVPNNSGLGRLNDNEIPEEIKHWNWGAFFLGYLWGIGNDVWISLLSVIPLVNIVMAFILGANGNRWAWESRLWPDTYRFQKRQKGWAVWGIVLFCLGVLYFGIAIMVSVLTTLNN